MLEMLEVLIGWWFDGEDRAEDGDLSDAVRLLVDLDELTGLGVLRPSPEAEPLDVVGVIASTMVERRRPNPLSNPLEKLLVGFGFSEMLEAAVVVLEMPETGVDIPELAPPRIVLTS